MEKIFMNTKNIKANDPQKFVLNSSQWLDIKSSSYRVALQNLSIYCTWNNVGQQHKNNKLRNIRSKMEWSVWITRWFLFSGRCSRQYLIYHKKHETLTNNPPIHAYINRINNRLVFKIKYGFKVELRRPETMKLLAITTKLIDKTKNGENVPSLEVVFVQFNLVHNRYQRKSEVLNTFTSNKSYAYLLTVEANNLVSLKAYNTEFDNVYRSKW